MPRTLGGNSVVANFTSGSISPGVIGMSGDVASTGVSIGIAPTGTMANNGAVTFGTALDRTYSEGLWLFYAAGAVAAGVPAAASFLWTVMSSATVGVVSNNTYTTGVPTVPTVVPFVTTGPGAFTGDTSERFVTLPVAANALGVMGSLEVQLLVRYNNSAGTKTPRIHWSASGGTSIAAAAGTTTTGVGMTARIANGLTNAQSTHSYSINSAGSVGAPVVNNTTVDTTVATSVVPSLQLGTATDWIILSSLLVRLDRSS